MIVGGQFQIARINVAVKDRRHMRVEIVEGIEQLIGPKHHPTDRKRLTCTLQPVSEVFAGDMLYDKKMMSTLAEMLLYFRKYGVI